MLHLSPSHRMVSEALATAIAAAPERREAIDMRAVDFGALYQLSVKPEELHTLRISLWSRCFDEVLSAVGQPFFAELYGKMLEPEAGQGFSITLVLNLDHIPPDQAAREALVQKLSSMKRDVVGAPLWLSFRALLADAKPPKPHYTVHYAESQCMYVVPQPDVVVIVFALCFSNATEAAIAKIFLQEAEMSRRQSKELAAAPSIVYTQEPPLELRQLGTSRPEPSAIDGFIGHVTIAVSKRVVEAGGVEKVVGLVQGYPCYLLYHVKATKSQLHTRIRARSTNWLQVLNRAMPEKLDKERKTISGRVFKR